MTAPIQVDVFYPIPESWGLCNSCELMLSQAGASQPLDARGLEEYPPELIEEFRRLSAAIYALAEHYQDQVRIKVWDPRSLQGLWKSIRYSVHSYPTFVINGKARLSGWDTVKVDQLVQSALESQGSAL